MGIACVSIHYIDLFLWLFDLEKPEISSFDYSGTYTQKRKGFFDMYGEIVIKFPGRATGRFINTAINGLRTMTVATKEKTVLINEDQRVRTEIHKNDRGNAKVTGIDYAFASNYMTGIIENFLKGNINSSGELVALDEAFSSHAIVYDFMERTGNKSLNIT